MVFLHGPDGTGYFLRSAEVTAALGEIWKPGHDTEFKVNENTVHNVAPKCSLQQLSDLVVAWTEQGLP